jgi:hypothetical protein
VAIKPIKKCPTSSIIQELKVKIVMRNYCSPIQMVKTPIRENASHVQA